MANLHLSVCTAFILKVFFRLDRIKCTEHWNVCRVTTQFSHTNKDSLGWVFRAVWSLNNITTYVYGKKIQKGIKALLRNEEKYVNIIWICRHGTRNKQEPTHCLATTWRCSAEIAFTVSTEILWKKRAQMVFRLLLREWKLNTSSLTSYDSMRPVPNSLVQCKLCFKAIWQ